MLPSDVVQRILEEVKPFTMVPAENLLKTIELTLDAVEAERRGDLVECGTWMGGSSFAMLLAQRYKYGRVIKPVWMLDSFRGLPQADERDGPLALEYQRNIDSPEYYDNCTAPLEKVKEAIDHFGFAKTDAVVVPGWFNETLPVHKGKLSERGISLLRVDCDWYNPVFYVLSELSDIVSEESAIILDDYYAWDGCARATHDFLSMNHLTWRIKSMDKFYGAWMVKRAHRRADV